MSYSNEPTASAISRDRHRTLDAATRLFMQLGEAFTMERLAAELRMSKKTLYRQFDNKTALLAEVLTGVAERMKDDIDAVIDRRDLATAEKLARVIEILGQRLASLGSSQAEAIRRDPVLWEHAAQLRDQCIITPITRVLEEGAERGELRSEIRLDLAVHLVPQLIEAVAQSDLVIDAQSSVGEVITHLGALLTHGLLLDNERRRPPEMEGRPHGR